MRLLRIGKRIILIFVPVLVVLTGAYYYAVTPHRPHAPVGSAEDLLFRADALAWNDRWEEAAPLYQRAEALFRAQGNQSRALYAAVSQIPPNQSVDIPATIWSLTTDLTLPGASDPETQLRILTVRGILQTNQDAAQAHSTWEEVEKLARKLHHYEIATRAVGEQGIAAFILGDALTAKKQVFFAWTAAKPELDPAAQVRYASVYAAGLVMVGRYNEALNPLSVALSIAHDHPQAAYPTLAVSTKIDALVGLHRNQEALQLANETLNRLKEGPFDGQRTQVYLSRGVIEADLGDRPAAVSDMKAALQLADHMHNFRGLTNVGGTLAQTYFDAGQLQEALVAIDAAIQANSKIPNELYLAPANLALKAKILDRMGRPEEADGLFRKSIALVDTMIRRASTLSVERQLLAEMSDIYSAYFAYLSDQNQYEAALQVLENVRGRLEAEALEHHRSQPLHQATPQEQELTRLNIALINTDDPKTRDTLLDRIYQTEIDLGPSKLATASINHPVTLAQLQRTVSSSQLLIEYVLAKPASYALAVTDSSIRAYRLKAGSTIETEVKKYRDEIHTKLADPLLGQALFNDLLAPIQEYSTHKDLVIVPDGELHLLPFSALVNHGVYVLASHTVDVAPSSTAFELLEEHSEQKASVEMPYIGVAAWTQASDSRNPVVRAISGPEKDQFVPLPHSKTEVEAIARDLPQPNAILLGRNATETNFKRLSGESADVIHLALHGYADVDYPDRSALIFAPEPNGPDDGLLQAREIRDLHIRAKLVTLSACDTGVGPVGETEVTNVVNAFIEAGADSVVSTLWDLDDESTEHLMTTFYSQLASRQRKVDALRLAQLDMLNKGLSPYFWGGRSDRRRPVGNHLKRKGIVMTLSRSQRETMLGKIQRLVAEKYFDPKFDEAVWNRIVDHHRGPILDANDNQAFERAVATMLAELPPSPLALLSERTLITPPSAINASFSIRTIDGQPHWVFKDVLPGGVAAKAGAKAGDILLAIDGKPVRPSVSDGATPSFEMQHTFSIVIIRADQELTLTLETATPKYKDNPYSEPKALAAGSQTGNVAYLRVSLFPGAIGIDFANELDAIFTGRFKNAERLLIDMRGNPGGGIGGLTLMSYLTPDRRAIGYSKSREMALNNTPPDRLPVFDRVPRSKLALPTLALKFLGKTSIFLYTEALGRRDWHGHTAILVDEHTAGAAEMVAQFAQENNLATIVGMKTPGRLVTRRASKLGFGYRLVIPIAAYVSAKGVQIEGNGVTPDVSIPWSYEDAAAGVDRQLNGAIEALRAA